MPGKASTALDHRGGSEFVPSIQALRALAAGLVALLHLSAVMAGFSNDAFYKTAHQVIATIGNAGVDIFFVISGAIMFMITRASAKNLSPIGESVSFLFRRAMRIYPLYWVTLAFAMWVLPTGSFPAWEEIVLLRANAAFAVAWTLPLEIAFYFMVALLLLLVPAQRRGVAFAIWGTGQTIYVVLGELGIVSPGTFNHSTMIEFVMGTAMAALIMRRTARRVSCELAIGAAMGWFAAATVFAWDNPAYIVPWRIVLYGIPAALLFYGVVALDLSEKWKIPRPIGLTGDASYSLYLWHQPLLIALLDAWPLPRDPAWSASLFLLACATLLASVCIASFYFLERPSIRLGRLIVGFFKYKILTLWGPQCDALSRSSSPQHLARWSFQLPGKESTTSTVPLAIAREFPTQKY